jgi:hypothetical protein
MAWINKDDLSLVDQFQLKKLLRIIPKSVDDVRPIQMYRETETHLGVPRVFFRKKFSMDNVDVTYDICNGRRLPKNEFNISLRKEDQAVFVDELLDCLTVGNWGAGTGEAYTGFGKSVIGIYLAQKLAVNTLILVHNEEIRDVWVNAIRQFYPNASIGIIQGDECDYTKDFVIAMCQSLMTDTGKYPQDLYRHFGLVFVDEVHRFGSRAFGSVAPKFNAKYMFGLSGTVRRSDDTEDVFLWVIGDIVAKAKEDNRIMPLVWCRNHAGDRPAKIEHYKDVWGNKQKRYIFEDVSRWSRPKLLRHLGKDINRIKMIARDVVQCLKSSRHPMLVAERKDILRSISEAIIEIINTESFFEGKKITHGFYFGDNDDSESSRIRLDAASRCTIIYATLQKAKEGVNIVRLDTLFLVTPNVDVEQVAGRICRPTVKEVDGVMKNQSRVMPIVFDYVDSHFKPCLTMFKKRLDLYHGLRWQIKDLNKIDFGG